MDPPLFATSGLPPSRRDLTTPSTSTPLGELLAASLPSPPDDWSPAPPQVGPDEPEPDLPSAADTALRDRYFYDAALEERARVGHLELQRGDRVLIVSDGVSGDLTPDQLRDLMLSSDDPDVVARSLTEASMQAFAADNVTALVILIEQAEPNLR